MPIKISKPKTASIYRGVLEASFTSFYVADLTVESLHILQVEAARWRSILGNEYENYKRMNRTYRAE
jgi:hypothetical protein